MAAPDTNPAAGQDEAAARLEYESARKELIQALVKKRAVDKALVAIEVQIYNFEGSYLTDTAAHNGGNIVQGFEGYLKNQSSGRRRAEASEADRIFSNSSATYKRSLELHNEGEESADDYQASKPNMSAGLTTVTLPAATRQQESLHAQQKKDRDRQGQRKRRTSIPKGSTASADEADVSRSARPHKRARLGGEE